MALHWYKIIPPNRRTTLGRRDQSSYRQRDPSQAACQRKIRCHISNDVTDSSGSVVIPKGSLAQLIAVQNGNDSNLDLRSVTVNGRRYLLTTQAKSSAPGGLGANKRTAKYVGDGAAVGARFWALCWVEEKEQRLEHWSVAQVALVPKSIPVATKKSLQRPS